MIKITFSLDLGVKVTLKAMYRLKTWAYDKAASSHVVFSISTVSEAVFLKVSHKI